MVLALTVIVMHRATKHITSNQVYQNMCSQNRSYPILEVSPVDSFKCFIRLLQKQNQYCDLRKCTGLHETASNDVTCNRGTTKKKPFNMYRY